MTSINNELTSIKVLIDGKPISEGYDILEVNVFKQINKIASARVMLTDGSSSNDSYNLSEGEELIPGKEIEIQAGYGLKTQCIFKGIITAQNIQFRSQVGGTLVLDCKDKAIKMTGSQNNGVFTNCTDSDALKKIVSNHGLKADIKPSSNIFPQIIQYNATDWDFILTRAEANGMIVIATDNQLKVTTPNADGSPVESLTFGMDILEFDSKMDAQSQLSRVEATAWNPKIQSLVKASASNPNVPNQGNITGSTLSSAVNSKTSSLLTTTNLEEAELKSWADSQLLKSRLAKITGEIKIEGNSKIEPNVIVKLDGFGSRFNGSAFVSGVTHEISNGNWFSYVSIGLDSGWFAQAVEVSARPASGLLPGIGGLQNGIVKKIYEDPKNEFRIEVEVPVFKNSGSSNVLARWTQPYASSGAGQFFMPEIGDEVVLGFLNEDPRFPVILGSLYSSQKATPYIPTEGNPKKAIVTKNQLKIEFDDENKVLTITTPSENKIIFSDKDESLTIQDQNKNKIKMDSEGITFNTSRDVKLTAEGSVTISGGTGVTISSEATATISAESSLSLSGLDASISAETSLSASGGAEASLTAGGELSITGAMVMIN